MIKSLLFSFILLFSGLSTADQLANELGQMCQHLKRCSMDKVSNDPNATPEIKQMMAAMFENTCKGIEQNYQSSAAAYPQHYQAARACVNSMSRAPCEKLMSSRYKTPECKKYEGLTSP